MKSVEEHGVFAAAVGNTLRSERLKRIAIHSGKGAGAYADCEEYIVGDLAALEEKLIKHLRITDALMEKWKCGGILFRVYLFERNGILTGGHIFKYRVSPEDLCCNCGYETSPTQQEIRLVGRILGYLSGKSG